MFLISLETEEQKEAFDEILDQLEEEKEELERDEQELIRQEEELHKEEMNLELEEEEIKALEQDEQALKLEENRYKSLLKQRGGKGETSEMEEMLRQIQRRRESMQQHKLRLGKILQDDGVDRVKKVSLTRSIADLHEWHEKKKYKLEEKQRLAQEKRRLEEDEKVRNTYEVIPFVFIVRTYITHVYIHRICR